MLEQWESLTQKYAKAFFNLYGNQFSDATIENVTACKLFLEQHKNLDAFLLLSAVPHTEKVSLLEQIYTAFKLPPAFINLGRVLLDHRRIDLLPQILQKLLREYQIRKNILTFTVYTSHPIDDAAKKNLTSFIQKRTQQQIAVQFSLDPKLICGVKIKSDTLQWERSIAKQLKIIKLDALQQVQL